MSKSISSQLKSAKLIKVKIPGDGNCQFNALSYVIKNSSIPTKSQNIDHRSLRKLAVNQISKNRSHYRNFIWDQSFDQYIGDMGKQREYGDELTLQAIAKYFKLVVVVLRNHRRRNIINPTGKYKVTLIYHGDDGHDAHYDATRMVHSDGSSKSTRKSQSSRKSRKSQSSRKSRKSQSSRKTRKTRKSRKSRKTRKSRKSRKTRVRKSVRQPRRKSRRAKHQRKSRRAKHQRKSRRAKHQRKHRMNDLAPEPRKIMRRYIDESGDEQIESVVLPVMHDPIVYNGRAIELLANMMIHVNNRSYSLFEFIYELFSISDNVYIEGSFVKFLYNIVYNTGAHQNPVGDVDLHIEVEFSGGYQKTMEFIKRLEIDNSLSDAPIGTGELFVIKLGLPLQANHPLQIPWKNPYDPTPLEISIVGGNITTSFPVNGIPKLRFMKVNDAVVTIFENIDNPYNSMEHNPDIWQPFVELLTGDSSDSKSSEGAGSASIPSRPPRQLVGLYNKYIQALELYFRGSGKSTEIPEIAINVFRGYGLDFKKDFKDYVHKKQGFGVLSVDIMNSFDQSIDRN